MCPVLLISSHSLVCLAASKYHMFDDVYNECPNQYERTHTLTRTNKIRNSETTVMRVERQKVIHLMHRLIVGVYLLSVQHSVDIGFN